MEFIKSYVVEICIAATVILCSLFAGRSAKNKKNGIIDDGAQQAVTIGVMFTFIGIIYSLVNFNVEGVDNIRQSITTFLSGMKTAFITSIIGIVFSMIIKIFIQGDVEHTAQQKQDEHFGKLDNLSKLNLLEDFKKFFEANNSVQNRIAANINTMAQNSTSANSVTDAIQSLKESIENSSSGALERAVYNLSDKMEQYIKTSQNTNGAINRVAEQLAEQKEAIDTLGRNLQKSNIEQIGAIDSLGDILKESGAKLNDTLKESGKTQNNNILALGEILEKSADSQIDAIEDLAKMLKDVLQKSGNEQNSRLDSMNALIASMLNYSKQTYENSITALNEARSYQSDSLEISRKQQEILSANTDRISEMKDAFNKFLDDMARKNNEEFIKALNESMKDLNQRLTEQFGDNFKQLNEAVIKLKDWQEDYQDVIEATTDELIELNDTFKKFSTDIAPKVAANAERLQNSVDMFAETSKQNIAIQAGLTDATQRLIDSINRSEDVAENLKDIHDGLIDYQRDLLDSLEKSFEKHQQKTLDALKHSADRFDEIVAQNQQTVTSQMQITAGKFDEIISKQDEHTELIAQHQSRVLQTLEDNFKDHQDKTAKAIEETTDKMADTVEKTTRKITSQMQATEETFENIIAQQFVYSDELKKNQDKFLQEIKTSFNDYQSEIIESMQNSAEKFDNVVIQVQNATKDALKDTLTIFDEVMTAQQAETEKHMQKFSKELNTIAEQDKATVHDALNEIKNAIAEIGEQTLKFSVNTSSNVQILDDTIEDVLNKISLAMDGFNTDFQRELEKAMTDLKTNLEKMLEKNSEVARKNSEELAAILATVTEKLVEEYSKMADHISEMDREIFERRAS